MRRGGLPRSSCHDNGVDRGAWRPSTGRSVVPASSIVNPPSPATTSVAVHRSVGSFGPPTPSAWLLRSCPTRRRTPPFGDRACCTFDQPLALVGGKLDVGKQHEVERVGGISAVSTSSQTRSRSRSVSRAIARARLIATAEKSIPVTRQPRVTSQSAFLPSPHARSSARPAGRSRQRASTNRFGASPHSSGFAAYRPSQSLAAHAGTGLLVTRTTAASVALHSAAQRMYGTASENAYRAPRREPVRSSRRWPRRCS